MEGHIEMINQEKRSTHKSLWLGMVIVALIVIGSSGCGNMESGKETTKTSTTSTNEILKSGDQSERDIADYNAVPQHKRIDIGWDHFVALKNDGTVWAWGANSLYQLGDGTSESSNKPIQVAGLSNMICVSAGGHRTAALKKDGTVWIWGGRNYNTDPLKKSNLNSKTPVQVAGLSDVADISAGSDHILALKKDGTVWAWGDNHAYQLGNGTNEDSNIPVQVSNLTNVIDITAESKKSFAVKNDGTVWTWGQYAMKKVGGETKDAEIPVQIEGVNNALTLEYKGGHMIVLKKDGTVWAHSFRNGYGDLVVAEPTADSVKINIIKDVKAVAANQKGGLILKNDGRAYEWLTSANTTYGNETEMLLAIDLLALQKRSDVTGIAYGPNNAAVLLKDGTLWVWGNNKYGTLGDGTFKDSVLPVKADINLN